MTQPVATRICSYGDCGRFTSCDGSVRGAGHRPALSINSASIVMIGRPARYPHTAPMSPSRPGEQAFLSDHRQGGGGCL